jgi:hypothetical protein
MRLGLQKLLGSLIIAPPPPPMVAARGGNDCLGVLRLEHGLLHRLAHAFLGLVAGLKETGAWQHRPL